MLMRKHKLEKWLLVVRKFEVRQATEVKGPSPGKGGEKGRQGLYQIH